MAQCPFRASFNEFPRENDPATIARHQAFLQQIHPNLQFQNGQVQNLQGEQNVQVQNGNGKCDCTPQFTPPTLQEQQQWDRDEDEQMKLTQTTYGPDFDQYMKDVADARQAGYVLEQQQGVQPQGSLHEWVQDERNHNGQALHNGPTIDTCFPIFDEERDLERETKTTNYGVLELLKGQWISYIGTNEKVVDAHLPPPIQQHNNVVADKGDPARPRNRDYNEPVVQNQRPQLGSGLHTTAMPSPGTTRDQIPGKFRFVCEEYIEVLTFDPIGESVRNRGGAVEQFCGAIKYDQNIKSLQWVNGQRAVKDNIHAENGMYLWLNKVLVHPATKSSIEQDRGIFPLEPNDPLVATGKYQPVDNNVEVFQDQPLYILANKGTTTPLRDPATGKCLKFRRDEINDLIHDVLKVIPQKDLRPGAGLDGPYYVPDYSISRSGVIPHGSTVTAIGKFKIQYGKPSFLACQQNPRYELDKRPEHVPPFLLFQKNPNPYNPSDQDHLALHPSMGGAALGAFYLCDQRPQWLTTLDHRHDPNENRVYSAQIIRHPLYPYSVRPDLRLFNAIRNQKMYDHIQIILDTERGISGPSGGIVNIPFVDRFVPTVRMKFNMWIERVEIKPKVFIDQLQYEQIVFFEFGHGDNGGVTRWPHIQVNTLRKLEDVVTHDYDFAVEMCKLLDLPLPQNQ